ncbi:addiction module toxin RelE [Staphylococcus croceilyticus]|uniref:Addiction module toxin RelE n=1 Tax=Staphylococcus croceilyticus TaxID=319942 RepID=A0ABY2KKE0_9STAP|nr:addiction module toxin RelE [Staphylococcus croceilyticus]PNZ70646.1 addiction module toxin RelE [Staphylococcus croceilyticus]TGA80945.1 addiction module toxin RelE [Staphylococcus croceilyticus]
MYRLKYHKKAAKEYIKLDGHQRKIVDIGLNKIRVYGMNCGQPLHGPLSGCRKLKKRNDGLRIVFRETVNDIEIIEIIAIGKRNKSEVYNNSLNRIN